MSEQGQVVDWTSPEWWKTATDGGGSTGCGNKSPDFWIRNASIAKWNIIRRINCAVRAFERKYNPAYAAPEVIPAASAGNTKICHVCGEEAERTCEICEFPVCFEHQAGDKSMAFGCREDLCRSAGNTTASGSGAVPDAKRSVALTPEEEHIIQRALVRMREDKFVASPWLWDYVLSASRAAQPTASVESAPQLPSVGDRIAYEVYPGSGQMTTGVVQPYEQGQTIYVTNEAQPPEGGIIWQGFLAGGQGGHTKWFPLQPTKQTESVVGLCDLCKKPIDEMTETPSGEYLCDECVESASIAFVSKDELIEALECGLSALVELINRSPSKRISEEAGRFREQVLAVRERLAPTYPEFDRRQYLKTAVESAPQATGQAAVAGAKPAALSLIGGTEDEWEQLRRLAEAATPGPYEEGKRGPNNMPILGARGLLLAMYSTGQGFERQAEANIAYAVASNPAALMKLIDQLRAATHSRAQAREEGIREALEALSEQRFEWLGYEGRPPRALGQAFDEVENSILALLNPKNEATTGNQKGGE